MVEVSKFDVSKIMRLVWEERNPEIARKLLFLQENIALANLGIDCIRKYLSECKVKDAVEEYGYIAGTLNEAKYKLVELSDIIPPDIYEELNRWIIKVREQIPKLIAEEVKTCSIKGLLR